MSTLTAQDMETVIGLEVHLQLKTRTKIFCGCANEFGQPPNSRTCPVCLGLPGSLPVLNEKALEYGVRVALGLNCRVGAFVKFDRKNYYYPDLPKGYQISQFDHPIAHDGEIKIPTPSGIKTIRVKRAHLEEDAGKLIHDSSVNASLVDYNRTGTPLLEIVTEPDISTPQEAYDYLNTLKLILQYLDVSDCDMEKGSLRCDANISVRRKGDPKLGTKTELKNMNSFRAVKIALEFEENRHRQMFLAGERIIQETRLWNDEKGVTVLMRSKEEAHDYRYFPEPDLVPFHISDAFIDGIRKALPELPEQKCKRLMDAYGLPAYDANLITQDKHIADFFEACTGLFPDVKKISNWIIGPLQSEMNNRHMDIGALPLTPQKFCEVIKSVEDGVVSNLTGKEVLTAMCDTGKSAGEIIASQGLAQVSDDSVLEKAVDEILAENAQIVEQIRQGKGSAMGFLVGQTMKKTQGKANPKKVGDIIKRRLAG